MIRFVVGPGAVVVPDIRRKLPGRGVWVTARAGHVAEAVKRQAFSRGFKTKVVASESLADEIEALLTKDCLQALSLASKAGQVVSGFFKTEAAIASGALPALFMPPIVGLRGCANSDKACSGVTAMSGRGHGLNCLPPANWIWHWGGQM